MRWIAFFVLIMYANLCVGQDKELSVLLNNKQYERAHTRAKEILSSHPNDIFSKHVLARTFFHLCRHSNNYLDSSIFYANETLQSDRDKGWLSGWSYYYLGMSHYLKGNYEETFRNLTKCITTNSTENVVKNAKAFIREINMSSYFKNWMVIASPHFIFHFQDTNKIDDIKQFIEKHEAAFVQNNKIFEANLPKKIDYFVWTDEERAKEQLHRALGYTNPFLCLCNVRSTQTVGHELTHVLSHWSWNIPSTKESRFINEGISVCFDISNDRTRLQRAKDAVKGTTINSVLDVWNNDRSLDEAIIYPVAGAFVRFLWESSTPEQFKSLVKNQTPDNARRVYGDKFEKMIQEFDTSIGLK